MMLLRARLAATSVYVGHSRAASVSSRPLPVACAPAGCTAARASASSSAASAASTARDGLRPDNRVQYRRCSHHRHPQRRILGARVDAKTPSTRPRGLLLPERAQAVWRSHSSISLGRRSGWSPGSPIDARRADARSRHAADRPFRRTRAATRRLAELGVDAARGKSRRERTARRRPCARRRAHERVDASRAPPARCARASYAPQAAGDAVRASSSSTAADG